jgi:hypothetical protein
MGSKSNLFGRAKATASPLTRMDVISLALLLVLIVLIMVVGDAVLYSWPAAVPRVYWALLDPIVHMLLSVMVVSPLFSHPALRGRRLRWLLIAAAVSALLDLDHIAAARSFDLGAILSLGTRPPTHSLLFGLFCGALTLMLTRNRVAAAIVFLALASHVIRDGSHFSAPLFWPLIEDTPVSIPAYHAAHIGIGLLATWGAGWPRRPLWTKLLIRWVVRKWQKRSI